MKEFPEWMNFLYCLSHSLFIAFGVILIATLIKRKLPLVMLAWPIAILMDIFTHTKDFFPTPFLWPFFDWTFSGISWGNSYFMAMNYILIISAISWIIYKKKFSKK